MEAREKESARGTWGSIVHSPRFSGWLVQKSRLGREDRPKLLQTTKKLAAGFGGRQGTKFRRKTFGS